MTRVSCLLIMAAALAGVPGLPGPARADAAPAPVRLTFSKSATATPMVWQGTVGGDVTGTLETRLLNLRVSGNIWHVEFDWIVTSSNPAQSFTARLTGILNLKTGRVVMNGTVIEGYLEGAQVHEEGLLVDPATSKFEGTIRIAPATAD
jgi:hypothetical protein